MKHINLFEDFREPKFIYLVLVESISGPDYGFSEIVAFPASNEEEAKRNFVNAINDGSGTTYLHNEGIYNKEFSDEFIEDVLEDNYFSGAGWNLSGYYYNKYPMPNNIDPSFKYALLEFNNDGWSRAERKKERKEVTEKLGTLIGKSEADEVMREMRKSKDEDFFRGIGDMMSDIRREEEREKSRLSALSKGELQKEIDLALDNKDYRRVDMLSKYMDEK